VEKSGSPLSKKFSIFEKLVLTKNEIFVFQILSLSKKFWQSSHQKFRPAIFLVDPVCPNIAGEAQMTGAMSKTKLVLEKE
jgi:hypothetical protein